MPSKSPISAQDKALFREMMRDVTPLNQNAPSRLTSPTTAASPEEHPHIDYDLSDYYAEPVQAESIINYYRHGLTSRQIHHLKSGQISFEAILDLHGLKPDEAKDRLSQFIFQQIQSQHRTVLIIHGKGGRYHEAPVLKNLVNHWLKQIPDILAFQSAQPKHGGTGAVYVLIRKKR